MPPSRRFCAGGCACIFFIKNGQNRIVLRFLLIVLLEHIQRLLTLLARNGCRCGYIFYGVATKWNDMMLIDNKYDIGDFVYLRTDDVKMRGIVSALIVSDGGAITYVVSFGVNSYQAAAFELSAEPEEYYE